MSLFINIFNRKRRKKLLEYILLIKKLICVFIIKQTNRKCIWKIWRKKIKLIIFKKKYLSNVFVCIFVSWQNWPFYKRKNELQGSRLLKQGVFRCIKIRSHIGLKKVIIKKLYAKKNDLGKRPALICGAG
jgi:hypothetical protein